MSVLDALAKVADATGGVVMVTAKGVSLETEASFDLGPEVFDVPRQAATGNAARLQTHEDRRWQGCMRGHVADPCAFCGDRGLGMHGKGLRILYRPTTLAELRVLGVETPGIKNGSYVHYHCLTPHMHLLEKKGAA